MDACEEAKDTEDLPENRLEQFVELNEVLGMINALKPISDTRFEKEFEHFTDILTRYQEQSHLLDPHLELLLQKLLSIIRDPESPVDKLHAAFKYLYIICKVRTYKTLVKFMPHELSDLEFALELLERQQPTEARTWETRYILLLWMSILVLNPFHMSRLDAYATEGEDMSDATRTQSQPKTKMERIYDLCLLYSRTNDTCATVAAFLSAKFLTRNDIKDIFLERYLDLVMLENQQLCTNYGQLSAVAAILKHGKREDLLPYVDKLLRWIIGTEYKNSDDFLKQKFYIKIIQRIGLVCLKPRIADWRYKRGTRSLALNLNKVAEPSTASADNAHESEQTDEAPDVEEIVVPDAVEEVIEELLQALRSAAYSTRWGAAKGVGRVTNRLPKELADEVIGSVIEILNPLEPHEAWHGACLALAELAKRGLLLPSRLHELVPLLLQALFYDEIKGYMSVGQYIRDSACYMCWAFARAYNPEDFSPFVERVSAGLLTVAAFDREVNCRRAASAAFQESVGRLGNFPHGIEISTATDFFTVGLRQNSFLNISDFIAQFEEYQRPMIEHLVERKVNHWDVAIRELSAKAMHKLTFRAPQYMGEVVLEKLFRQTDSIDINMRHGAVLAIGEIVLAFSQLPEQQLSDAIKRQLNELIGKFLKRELFRGMSGELMKDCCTKFMRNCSLARIEADNECLANWQLVIDKCLLHKSAALRESAVLALGEICKAYYEKPERAEQNAELIRSYLTGAEAYLEENIRMGYSSALGVLPRYMAAPLLDEILDSLIRHALVPRQDAADYSATVSWSEARRDGIKALSKLVQTFGFAPDTELSFANPKYFNLILDCLLNAMNEYTLDNRGDIGAWVREAAMNASYEFITTCPKQLLTPAHVHKIILCLVQQSVEKIDRTRGLAGSLFCSLVHFEPAIPHISHHNELKHIFPKDPLSVPWFFADHTFVLFAAMLEWPEYSRRLLLGISASMGQMTESLVKHSSSAFFDFLRSHTAHVPRLCAEIISIFEENLYNDRVTYPMLSFLDLLIGSGTIDEILLDASNNFADEVFRLVSLEIKGFKKLYKLTSSVSVYCQLIQVPRLVNKVLTKMAMFFGLTHVFIRKTTATKLYEALALYGDVCTAQIPEENLDEVLFLLSEFDWGLPLVEVRPVRNKLCELMGVQPPVSAATAQQQQQLKT